MLRHTYIASVVVCQLNELTRLLVECLACYLADYIAAYSVRQIILFCALS